MHCLLCLGLLSLQKLCDWIDANNKSCCAFDFPSKGILQVGAGTHSSTHTALLKQKARMLV